MALVPDSARAETRARPPAPRSGSDHTRGQLNPPGPAQWSRSPGCGSAARLRFNRCPPPAPGRRGLCRNWRPRPTPRPCSPAHDLVGQQHAAHLRVLVLALVHDGLRGGGRGKRRPGLCGASGFGAKSSLHPLLAARAAGVRPEGESIRNTRPFSRPGHSGAGQDSSGLALLLRAPPPPPWGCTRNPGAAGSAGRAGQGQRNRGPGAGSPPPRPPRPP